MTTTGVFVVLVPLQPAVKPTNVRATRPVMSCRVLLRSRGSKAVRARERSPRLAARIVEVLRVTGAVVWTVRVAVATWSVIGTVSGSQVVSVGSCERELR